jgi:hypothetical protein
MVPQRASVVIDMPSMHTIGIVSHTKSAMSTVDIRHQNRYTKVGLLRLAMWPVVSDLIQSCKVAVGGLIVTLAPRNIQEPVSSMHDC